MIRISGGKFRSRLLKTPNTIKTKPTMDKVRQGVFSSIGDVVINATVLDLFAGSGSYGFEALSRGAKTSTFVDNGRLQINIIKDNARALGCENLSSIICKDCVSYLKETDDKFDIIFVDPPYALDVYYLIIDLVFNKNVINEKGILILESENGLNIDENIFKIKHLKYGTAKIYIIRRK